MGLGGISSFINYHIPGYGAREKPPVNSMAFAPEEGNKPHRPFPKPGKPEVTTLALGEESGHTPRLRPVPHPRPRPFPKLPPISMPFREEGGTVTTLAVGEESGAPPGTATTQAIGEEAGGGKPGPVTTLAVGEEGGHRPYEILTKAHPEEPGQPRDPRYLGPPIRLDISG